MVPVRADLPACPPMTAVPCCYQGPGVAVKPCMYAGECMFVVSCVHTPTGTAAQRIHQLVLQLVLLLMPAAYQAAL